jgi:hypothetical protein
VCDGGFELSGTLVAAVHHHAPRIHASRQAGVQLAGAEAVGAGAFLLQYRKNGQRVVRLHRIHDGDRRRPAGLKGIPQAAIVLA